MAKSLGEFKSAHAPDQEVEFLRARVAELERQHKIERETTGEAREIIFALSEAIKRATPTKMAYRAQKGSGAPITQVLQLTDLHYGEVIAKDEVEGINEFNPEIAVARLEQFGAAFDGVIAQIRADAAAGAVPPDFVVAGAIETTQSFLAPSPEENPLYTTYVDRLGEIDPAACRARVEDHFSGPAMVRGYEAVFRQVTR